MEQKINITIEPCTECGMYMTMSDARIEDGFETGVVECICPKCGTLVTVSVKIYGVDSEIPDVSVLEDLE